MEIKDLKIDSETANLIIQIYQKIDSLKHQLENDTYVKIKQIIESGITIDQLLEEATSQTNPENLQLKLTTVIKHLHNLVSNTNYIESIIEKNKLEQLYTELSNDLSILQLKINSEL
jgi:hypothetical protein